MISVIISSQKKETFEKVKNDIEDTIGVAFEIIVIENSLGKIGICEAYNHGAANAQYDILCFMHEDVSFETQSWGEKLLSHLSDNNVGLIGLAGGDTKSIVPSGWSSSVFNSEISIIQHFKHADLPPRKIIKTGYPDDHSKIKNVVCVDGVWMCTRKDVFEKYKYDSKTFKGFHGYDIDFSLQVFSEYKVCVVFDILINHYSEGNYTKIWMDSMIAVSDKWKKSLPKSVRVLSKKELVSQHWTSMGSFLEKLSLLHYSFPVRLKYFLKYSCNRFFQLAHFLHFLKLLLTNDFKKVK